MNAIAFITQLVQMKDQILTKKFFNRPTLVVAKDLLGKYLVRKIGKNTIRYLITEVEAYDGFKDKASHASRGKTLRNAPMFGEAGSWYVYFTYGMHYMLNIVTGPKNYPAAVLIRGIQYLGRPTSNGRRTSLNLNGPAKLTKQLKIDKRFNNKITSPKTGLWIEGSKFMIHNSRFMIQQTPRVGVVYSGPVWSKKPWRFVLEI